VVRWRWSAAGHGWRWPAVRPVPAAGEMRKTTAAAAVTGERKEDGCDGGGWRRKTESSAGCAASPPLHPGWSIEPPSDPPRSAAFLCSPGPGGWPRPSERHPTRGAAAARRVRSLTRQAAIMSTSTRSYGALAGPPRPPAVNGVTDAPCPSSVHWKRRLSRQVARLAFEGPPARKVLVFIPVRPSAS
jgi:hypothetical protein